MRTRDFTPSTLVRGGTFFGLAKYAGRSLEGGRTNNEDGFVCAARFGLFAVADGMGGHNAGEVASALALDQLAVAVRDRIAQQTTRTRALLDAFGIANRQVFAAGQRTKEHAGMGCTLSAVLLAPPLLLGAHIGDSRIYRLRGDALVQLTRDHAVPQMPNILTRAIGTNDTVDVDTFTTRIAPDDVFLLCTDGVTNVLADPVLARLLASARRSPSTAVDAILRAALPDANDNLTAVVLRIESRS
jgi:serine/threonine protein phosphatase PrpC